MSADAPVVVITGGGRGLGRCHALALATAGYRVVVNDIGSDVHGEGVAPTVADTVVAEIHRMGGEAVAAPLSIVTADGADAVIDRAMSAFGRIDGVVHSAGILRDRTFGKMTEEDIRSVLDVHLVGGLLVCRAAWPHLRARGFGRIVLTSSGAGLYGNFGQTNYAAAKMALVGATRTLAMEGARAGILVNAIAPVAGTRMTEELMPAEFAGRFPAELVSPVVVHLVSADCDTSGEVFSVGGGHVARVAIVETRGVRFPDGLTAADAAARWDEIRALTDPEEFTAGTQEQAAKMLRIEASRR